MAISWQSPFLKPGIATSIPILPKQLNFQGYHIINVPQNCFYYTPREATSTRFVMTEGCGPCVGLSVWHEEHGGLIAHFDESVLGNFDNAIFTINCCIPTPQKICLVTSSRAVATRASTTRDIIARLEENYIAPDNYSITTTISPSNGIKISSTGGDIYAAEADAIILHLETGKSYLQPAQFHMIYKDLNVNFARQTGANYIPRGTYFGRIS